MELPRKKHLLNFSSVVSQQCIFMPAVFVSAKLVNVLEIATIHGRGFSPWSWAMTFSIIKIVVFGQVIVIQ